MPPLRKFSKDDIIDVAYEIVKKEGIKSLNARKIASELKSSVQPLFHNFTNMEELKNSVIAKIYNTYQEYMRNGALEEKAYKGMGIAYIKFAKEYPNFFKVLFMSESKLSPTSFIQNDDTGNNVIKNGQIFSGLSIEQQKIFHLKVWIFTHGIATMVVSKTVEFSDEEIEELLSSTTREMLIGYKKNIKEEN